MALLNVKLLRELRTSNPDLAPEIDAYEQAWREKSDDWNSESDVRTQNPKATRTPNGEWLFPLSNNTNIVAQIKFANPAPSRMIVVTHG